MERPIGREFMVGDVKLRVEKSFCCNECYSSHTGCISLGKTIGGLCGAHSRSDHKSVIFKKVEANDIKTDSLSI